MKLSSFFKPVISQWNKVTGKNRANSSAILVPRASSVSSWSAAKQMSSIGSISSQDSYSHQVIAHPNNAIYNAYVNALQSRSADPLRGAQANPFASLATEKTRVTGLVQAHRTAQQNHTEAKQELANIGLQLEQAKRELGVDSPEFSKLKSQQSAAIVKLEQAGAHLFLAKIAFVS